MAITSSDIHNQSFSIDRKGYDVDEVDVFLEHVAAEIDELNEQIAQLESQADDDRFGGFDTPAHVEEEPEDEQPSSDVLAEKDARIAELEAALEAKKADDNAIAQALIIAQRSADEIIANANAKAAQTIKDAEAEADRIMDRVEGQRQDVIDNIKQLEDDREDSREEYQELLRDFIADASRKLAEIGGDAPAANVATSMHARPASAAVAASAVVVEEPVEPRNQQAPIRPEGEVAAYTTPQAGATVAVAAMPKPSAVEKDFSGFGDADDEFEFEEID